MRDKYDLIVSLGGNCSAAHNLRFRGLRPVSLPFDWVYLVDEQPIRFWIKEAGDGFPNLLKRENLVEVRPGERGYAATHADRRQYVDSASGYRFVNHFHQAIEVPGEYEAVFAAIRRRADRLVSAFAQGGRFLLVLATPVSVPIDALQTLLKVLSESYGKSRFALRYLHFEQTCDQVLDLGAGLVVQNIQRKPNDYDFFQTNWEWSWLDGLDVGTARKHRRKVSFRIWPKIDCVISLERKGEKG